MRIPLAIAMLILSTAAAMADCKQVVRGEGDNRVWACMPPQPAQPPPAPIKCSHISGVLLCNGDLGDDGKPGNCGWKSGKYICW